jgi:hypothetical protein
VIDKIELRVPCDTRFTEPVQEAIREIDYLGGRTCVRRSQHYSGIADLRPLEIDALLHAYCKHGKHDHKLELLDTGKKSYSELASQIESVFVTDPFELALTRLDLCADVKGTPVSWFQPRVRVKYKRFANERGELEYEQMGNRKIETLTAGKRPNMFRIYDKTAECKMQLKKLQRKTSPDADPLDFEKEFGFPPESVLTRVERQFGGGRVPPELGNFGKLANAPQYNPFAPLEIVNGSGAQLPSVEECSGVNEWLCGMQLRYLAKKWGMPFLRPWLNQHSPGNAARILDKYRKFLPSNNEQPITAERLYETYRESVIRQLSA